MMHAESARKGRKAIGLGPLPLEGDSEAKGDWTGREPPWGVSGSSHRLGAPVLGSYVRETSPVGWLEDHGGQQRAVEILDWTPLWRRACALACLRAGWRGLP